MYLKHASQYSCCACCPRGDKDSRSLLLLFNLMASCVPVWLIESFPCLLITQIIDASVIGALRLLRLHNKKLEYKQRLINNLESNFRRSERMRFIITTVHLRSSMQLCSPQSSSMADHPNLYLNLRCNRCCVSQYG
jgi:hypothetical protein